MQIVVLGMHRSGTSMVSRLLNLMGAYFGPEGMSTGVNDENPTGFWERRDVRYLNDRILHAQNLDWDLLSDFDCDAVSRGCDGQFKREIKSILFEMDAHRPWFIKEPRLCLLMPLWREAMENPVCVFVYRNPIEVAKSLNARNNIPLPVGRALWELYNIEAIEAASTMPTAFISHHKLIYKPVDTTKELFQFLSAQGVRGLTAPSRGEIESYVEPALYRQQHSPADLEAELSESERLIWRMLSSSSAESGPELLFTERSRTTLADYQSTQLTQRQIETNNLTETAVEKVVNQLDKKVERTRDRLMASEKSQLERISKISADAERYAKKIDELEELQRTQAEKLDLVQERLIQSAKKLRKNARKNRAVRQQQKRTVLRLERLENALLLQRRSFPKRIISRCKLALSLIILPVRFGPRRGSQLMRDFFELRRSGAFNTNFYLRHNPDVALKGVNPLLHFVIRGNREGRNPRANFSTAQYAQEHFINLNRRNALADSLRNEKLASSRPVNNISINGGSSQNLSKRLKVIVLSWDMGHNPVGRAYLIADLLSQQHDVELWGAHFPRYGAKLWEPIRDNTRIKLKTWEGADLPKYYDILGENVAELDCDVLYVCKPRFPSIAFGLLAKHKLGMPVILDIDDYELSFFKDESPLPFSADLIRPGDKKFKVCHDGPWTQVSDTLVDFADAMSVSNTALKKKYGGLILPHVRNEKEFIPNNETRSRIRRKLGIAPEEKIVLFVGTPRMHKGIAAIHQALVDIGNPDYKLLVIGTAADEQTKRFLQDQRGNYLMQIENIPFLHLSNYLNVGDLVCLLQDIKNPVSKYQLPAKLIDALAMGIPTLVSNAPPLQDYIEQGLVIVTAEEQLSLVIDEIFTNYSQYKKQAMQNRTAFDTSLSYSAHQKTVSRLIHQATTSQSSLSPKHTEFCKHITKHLADKTIARIAAAQHSRISLEKPRYNIVYFWKQNDSGVYGRRQDMLVKYLKQHSRVNKLLHIDAPISRRRLIGEFSKSLKHRHNQHWLVLKNTLGRIKGRRIGKSTEIVFTHNGSPSNVNSYINDYLDFLDKQFAKHKIFQKGVKTVFVVCPRNFEFPFIFKRFRPDVVAADIIDNHLKWPVDSVMADRLKQNYTDVIEQSDVVLVNNETNQDEMRAYCDDVHLLPNAGERFTDQEIKALNKPAELKSLKSPIVGYVGNLDILRLDLDLLEKIAGERPNYSFVFIGSMHQNQDIKELDKHANVHFLGTRRYSESLAFIKHFDVAIIPHLDNELTRVMDPLKLYVYLSVGVPVVSTPVELNPWLHEHISIADDHHQFLAKLDEACSSCDETQAVTDAISHEHSWNARVDSLIELIDQAI